jgi:hypothetical protein
MISILAEKIHDNRFLRLIKQMLGRGTWRIGNGTKRSAAVRRGHYVKLNITRLMNSAGLCAALAAGPADSDAGAEHCA